MSVFNMKCNKFCCLILFFAICFVCHSMTICAQETEQNNAPRFGVFLGVDSEKLADANEKMDAYDIIVIDAQQFSSAQIRQWKSEGKTVYSYLNVGSLETYRAYYQKYQQYALAPYEHWKDEYWMDVSQKSWQKNICKIGKKLSKKGVDGFFLDNTDVYYLYPKTEIYEGLIAMIKGLGNYTDTLIINGGDVFVKQLIKNKQASLISGVCQESVFSQIIDYEKNIFRKQQKSSTNYYKKYLNRCKKAGLDVYLIEYTRDKKLRRNAEKYCARKGYGIYVSSTVGLD